MDGDFDVVQGTLHGLLTALLRGRCDLRIRKDLRLLARAIGVRAANALRGNPSNVRAHYDLGLDLFEAFLDPTLTYSCGYAESPDDSLEQLQINKFERICRKLRLAPGQRLLDVGCGFAGLLIHAAQNYGVEGRGITLSRDQCRRARELVARAGLEDRVHIELSDYRDVGGRFDRVVSVGMLEHVPPAGYPGYFRKVAQVLRHGGLGLVHCIGCNGRRNGHDPFIQKYIFPGSSQPRLSDLTRQLERFALAILDVENLVRHYGHTVHRWLENFRANGDRLPEDRYDRRFRRMWEYYLSCGIAAARASDGAVYQILFTNDRAAELPLRRV
jgi:cyclopropane-fatty-acyl-phospholipid synthase